MPIRIKLDRTESGFEPIPEGSYKVIAQDFDERKAQSGTPYVSVMMEIVEGQYAGRKLFRNLMLEGPGKFTLYQFLDAVRAPKTGEAPIESFADIPFVVVVKHQEYNGEIRETVDRMMPLPDSGTKPKPKRKGLRRG